MELLAMWQGQGSAWESNHYYAQELFLAETGPPDRQSTARDGTGDSKAASGADFHS
jgi:hypothetical protein